MFVVAAVPEIQLSRRKFKSLSLIAKTMLKVEKLPTVDVNGQSYWASDL